jgi:hypothetical protein
MYDLVALPDVNASPFSCYARRLNQKGDVVGFSSDTEGDFEVGTIWKSGWFDFSLPKDLGHSGLDDINDSGDAVGTAIMSPASATSSAILVQGGKVVDLSPVVGVNARAVTISNNGLVGGWLGQKSFLYNSVTQKVDAMIDPLPGKGDFVITAINGHGDAVGTSGDRGVFYSGGALKDLGPIPYLSDLNDAGVACGSVRKPGIENYAPAFWDLTQSSPAPVELPIPAGFAMAQANGINNKREVVGTCWKQPNFIGFPSACFHSPRTGISIDLNTLISDPNFILYTAEAINDAGQITGQGAFQGKQCAYVLTPRTVGATAQLTLPELVAFLFGGITRDGGGWAVVGPQSHPVGPWDPEGPWARWLRMPEAKRDALIALAMDEMAMFLGDREARETVRRSLIQTAVGCLQKLELTSGQGRPAPTVTGMDLSAEDGIRLHEGKLTFSLPQFRLGSVPRLLPRRAPK